MKASFLQNWIDRTQSLRSMALATLLLFFLAAGFSLFLCTSTLRHFAAEAILREYANVGTQLQTIITRGLNFGRPLQGFVGLHDHIVRTRDALPGIVNITVHTADGRLVDSLSLPQSPASPVPIVPGLGLGQWKKQGAFTLELPLEAAKSPDTGYLTLSVNADYPERPYRAYSHAMLALLLAIGPLVCLLQVGCFALLPQRDASPEGARKRLRLSMLLCIGGAQVLFGAFAIHAFRNELHASSLATAQLAGRSLANNLAYLATKNIQIHNIPGIGSHMSTILQANPDLGGLRVRLANGLTEQAGETQSSQPVSIAIEHPASDNISAPIGWVEVYTNPAHSRAVFSSLVLNQLTVLTIALILLYELSGVAAVLITRPQRKTAPTAPDQHVQGVILNTGFFIFFFAYDTVISFIPLAAEQLPAHLIPVSGTLHSALPISAEALFSTIAVATSGLLKNRFGWKHMLCCGVYMGFVGAILAFMSTNLALFTAARACAGFAMGLVLMAGQLYIIEHSSSRLEALAALFAALFAGGLGGSACGGILYDLFDFHIIFALSGGLILLSLPVFNALVTGGGKAVHTSAQGGFREMWMLVRNRAFLVPVLLVGAPAGMALTGFLYLAVPLLMQQQHFAQADIGRMFMLYGMCFVFIGPYMARIVRKCHSQTAVVAFIGLAGGCAVLLTRFMPTSTGFALAVLLMGIAQCLLASSMMEYILSLPDIAQVDSALAGSGYRLCERIGQVMGPVIFGAALMLPAVGLLATGLALVLSGGAFMLWNKAKGKKLF